MLYDVVGTISCWSERFYGFSIGCVRHQLANRLGRFSCEICSKLHSCSWRIQLQATKNHLDFMREQHRNIKISVGSRRQDRASEINVDATGQLYLGWWHAVLLTKSIPVFVSLKQVLFQENTESLWIACIAPFARKVSVIRKHYHYLWNPFSRFPDYVSSQIGLKGSILRALFKRAFRFY